DVEQTPLFEIPSLGQNVSLTCRHDDSQFIYKYWYRQEEGKELVFIGSTYRETLTMGNFAQEKMSIKSSEITKSQLIINNFSAEDSAIYYCASSIHSETKAERDRAGRGCRRAIIFFFLVERKYKLTWRETTMVNHNFKRRGDRALNTGIAEKKITRAAILHLSEASHNKYNKNLRGYSIRAEIATKLSEHFLKPAGECI
uniref:Ig-like domain-containing protein n=1 Tax=Leptobrachium leishanense TaxID=445787 RepID=A0A8C5PR01_9ANUR